VKEVILSTLLLEEEKRRASITPGTYSKCTQNVSSEDSEI